MTEKESLDKHELCVRSSFTLIICTLVLVPLNKPNMEENPPLSWNNIPDKKKSYIVSHGTHHT